ncbi:MAG: hypothetical protein M3Z04_25535 [Chloroflexota bacterium]|nr:hypothetical protein [Chloroflexota bacterium]
MHVGDRGADIFEFMPAVRVQGCHFLVRVAQDRAINVAAEQGQGQAAHRKSFARSLQGKRS